MSVLLGYPCHLGSRLVSSRGLLVRGSWWKAGWSLWSHQLPHFRPVRQFNDIYWILKNCHHNFFSKMPGCNTCLPNYSDVKLTFKKGSIGRACGSYSRVYLKVAGSSPALWVSYFRFQANLSNKKPAAQFQRSTFFFAPRSGLLWRSYVFSISFQARLYLIIT